MKSINKAKLADIRILVCMILLSLVLTGYSGNRTYRVIMLDSPGEDVTDLYLFNGIDSTKIQYSRTSLSPIYELPHGDLKLVLTNNKEANPEGLPDDAPSVEVDEAVADVLIVLQSDPENQLIPLKMTIIDISDDKLKEGQTVWLNYTANTISAELGDITLVISPDAQPISNAPLLASGFFKAVFSYRTPDSETFSPIMRKSWWLDLTSKNIGFIVDDKRSRLPRIFTLRDKR